MTFPTRHYYPIKSPYFAFISSKSNIMYMFICWYSIYKQAFKTSFMYHYGY